MNLEKYNEIQKHRQEIIRRNASRRMRGESHLQEPVPPKPAYPMAVQLETPEGDYIGTWPAGVSEADARAEAAAQGYTVGKATLKRAIR